MPTVIQAYACSKCGLVGLTKKGTLKHEQIPITSRNDSLDGLIMRDKESYTVFIETGLSPAHEALYLWNNYYKKSLREKISEIEKRFPDVTKKLKEFLGYHSIGVPAELILNRWEDNEQRLRTEEILPLKEFIKVTDKLATKYPERYAHTQFKRMM